MNYIYSPVLDITKDEGDIVLLESTGANPARLLTEHTNLHVSDAIQMTELLTEAHIRGRQEAFNEMSAILTKKLYEQGRVACQKKTN